MYQHFEPSERVFVDREEYIYWMDEALKRCRKKSVVLHLRGIGGIGKSSLLDHWNSTVSSTIRLDCEQYTEFYDRLNVLAKGAVLLGVRLQRFDVLWQIRQRFVEGVEPVKEEGREWAKEIALAIPFIGSLASIGSAISAAGSKVAPKLKSKYGDVAKWLQTRLGKNHVEELLEILWKEPRHAEFLYLDALLEDINNRKKPDTPLLFLLDHFEYVDNERARWGYSGRQITETELWSVFLSSLSNCVGVMASRRSALSPKATEVEESELTELDRESCIELLELRQIVNAKLQNKIVSVSGGNPFVIGALCDLAKSGTLSLEDVEDLRADTLEEVRLRTWRRLFRETQDLLGLVDRAGLLPFFNRRVMNIIAPDMKTDQWDRLTRLSFVRNRGDGTWVLHDLAEDLVRAEIGTRLNVISKEVAGLLEKAHNDNPDVTLLGLARSVQALVSPAETLQQIYLDIDNLNFVMAANEIMTYLDSLKVETDEGRAALMGMKGFTLLSFDRVADAEHMLLELLDMSQEIAKSDPKTGRGLVAASHHWLGRLYSQTDRTSEADAAFKKALELGRSLVKSDPRMYVVGMPIELAHSTTFLFHGSHMMALGRLSEAKQKLRKADQLMKMYFQKPDAERDDRFRHMVPYTQVRLALALFLSGDIPGAEELYRELVRTSKEPLNRASSLWNLGEILRTTDRMDEAEEIAREVVVIHRTASREDVVYDEALALSLNNLASILRVTGRQVEAQDAYRKALGIMRGLVEKAPESYRLRTLAWTLCDLGALLTESGNFAEAEKMYQESLDISRKLADQARERNLGRLSATLNNYAVLLSNDGKESPSEKMLREALEILEQITQDKPETVLLHDLVAAVLNNLGILLRSSKRASEALETLQRAHTIQSKLAEKAPQLFSRYLATVLNNLGIAHFENGSQSMAEEHIQKALEIWRELCQKAPDQYMVHIASALNNLAVVYDKKNNHQKAEELREEALTITNQLSERGILLQTRVTKLRNSIKSGEWLEEYREIVNPPTLG